MSKKSKGVKKTVRMKEPDDLRKASMETELALEEELMVPLICSVCGIDLKGKDCSFDIMMGPVFRYYCDDCSRE